MARLYCAMETGLLLVEDPAGTPTSTHQHLDRRSECVHADGRRVLYGTFDGGLLRSTDGGTTWTRPDALARESVTALAAAPGDRDVLWAGTEPSAVYRSPDGGATWTRLEGLTDLPSEPEWAFPPRPHTHHVRWIEPDPADPSHLYVSIEAGALVQTHDGGETWEDRVPGARRDTHSMATHPDAPGRAWTAAGDGYAETRDAGETWTYPQAGLDHRYCWSVALDSDDPDTVLMSAARSARYAHRTPGAESYLYRRTDDADWEPLDDRGLPTGDGVTRAVLVTGEEGETFYAANNRGVYRTTDAGDAWTRLDVTWPETFADETVRGLALA
jgi:photosystem II stability/assembly factor-like uncharacterized protein